VSWHSPLDVSDRVVTRAARGMNRRRFFRNAGAGALGLTLGSRLVMRGAEPAIAHGSPSHPCGPSPLCPSGRCFDGNCSNAAGRYYATYTCHPNALGGCWREDYRGTGQGYWQCCDCCALDGSGSACSGCSPRRACICRKRLA
jgi:hypothetical protein